MEEKDLSQNPEQENKGSKEAMDPESRKNRLVKAVVKDIVEFSQFDMIHKIYFMMLSREALNQLTIYFGEGPEENKSELRILIENYYKRTYTLIRNYLQRQNLATINEEIDNIAKNFFSTGHLASELYFDDALFSQRGYEMLKLYLTSTFVLPLLRKADSKMLYDDIKGLRISSKTRGITTDFNEKQVAIINNLANSSLDLSYSAFALKKSERTFNDYNNLNLDLDFDTLATEQIRTIPYNDDYDGDTDPEKMNEVYIKVNKNYKKYYAEKIRNTVEQFFKSDITNGKVAYFYVTIEIYLALAAQLMKHDNIEVGTYIALTVADQCSRMYAQHLTKEDFLRVSKLKNMCSNTINKSLTLLYYVGNIVDQHDLNGIFTQIKEAFAEPSEHYMGVTDLKVYFNTWEALTKYGKNGIENFLQRNAGLKKDSNGSEKNK